MLKFANETHIYGFYELILCCTGWTLPQNSWFTVEVMSSAVHASCVHSSRSSAFDVQTQQLLQVLRLINLTKIKLSYSASTIWNLWTNSYYYGQKSSKSSCTSLKWSWWLGWWKFTFDKQTLKNYILCNKNNSMKNQICDFVHSHSRQGLYHTK